MSDLAGAWKRKAKMYRRLYRNMVREHHEWRQALRLAGIGRMGDLDPDAIRLTITVPSQKRIEEMVEERVAARVAPSPDAPGPHAQPRPEATLIVKAIDALEQDSDQYGALSFLKAALRATTPDRAALAASGAAPREDVECPHCDVRHQWPCPTIPRCDEPGCEDEADCGWPTKAGAPTFSGDPDFDGYRRTCGKHMRLASESHPTKEQTDD
jgi:hypothetical protein